MGLPPPDPDRIPVPDEPLVLGKPGGKRFFAVCGNGVSEPALSMVKMSHLGAVSKTVLPTGLVGINVCTVDTAWSGLKFMIRKELH
jgi:hypothetical protein